MLKHIVLMKFKTAISEKEVNDLKCSLMALPELVKDIQGYECGSDLRPTKAFDFALVATFADFDALKHYQVHPDHVVVGTKVRSMSERLEIVDFEY